MLDTHLMLWAAESFSRLPTAAQRILELPDSRVMFSVASLWEVAIKTSRRREDFHVDPALLRRGMIDGGWEEVPILAEHAVAVTSLPPLHKDPFD